jgi:hypothetical protein
MALIADILLVAGALSAGLYCLVLSRRLTRFTDLEKGVGGAVAVLSAQVDDMTKALASARSAAGVSAESLQEMTIRAETVAERLEILLAAMHDLPEEQPEVTKARRVVWRRPRETAQEEEEPVRVAFTRSVGRGAAVEAAE